MGYRIIADVSTFLEAAGLVEGVVETVVKDRPDQRW